MDFRKIIGAVAAILLVAALSGGPKPALAQDTFGASGQIIPAATSNANLAIPLLNSQTMVGFGITGLTAAGATLTIEGSADGQPITTPGATTQNASKVWATVGGTLFPGGSTTPFTTLNADQIFRVDVAGLDAVRLRVSSTGTGNITVGYRVIYGANGR